MFRFNFNEIDETPIENLSEENEKSWEDCKKCELIKITADQYTEIAQNLKTAKVNCIVANDLEIGYLDNSTLTDKSDNDLIPCVYEGGFKIWECTQDLADLLTSSEDEHDFEGKSVCDLGCAAGILGIIALVEGATKVDFQDYVSFI